MLNVKSKVNVINQAFALQPGLKIQKFNFGAQKINSTILKAYRMVVFIFFILTKDGRIRFFKKNILLANVKLDVVFGMFFLMNTLPKLKTNSKFETTKSIRFMQSATIRYMTKK